MQKKSMEQILNCNHVSRFYSLHTNRHYSFAFSQIAITDLLGNHFD